MILFWGIKCRASFLREQSQQILCITLHNLNLWAKSKKPLVQNPNETCKPLKKALENWIKLAISQSGPAATLKQKGLVHFHEHTGRNCAYGCFSLIFSSNFSRELLSKGGQILLQASLFSLSVLSNNTKPWPECCTFWLLLMSFLADHCIGGPTLKKLRCFLCFPCFLYEDKATVHKLWI